MTRKGIPPEALLEIQNRDWSGLAPGHQDTPDDPAQATATVTITIPKELAESGYWRDMENPELEAACMVQLLEQGCWTDPSYSSREDDLNEFREALAYFERLRGYESERTNQESGGSAK